MSKTRRSSDDQQLNYQAKIAEKFGQAAAIYQAQAVLQHRSAKQLLKIISAYHPYIPSSSIIEVGCGTGFITQGLIQAFPQHLLEITDFSTNMLDFCRSYVLVPDVQQHRVSFQLQDGEKLESRSQKYAAIVSGFVIQWFKKPVQVLQSWLDCLQPGGFLFLSFPTCHSFPEWQQICVENQIPFTANPLPDPALLLRSFTDQQIRYQEVIKTVDLYSSAAGFLHGLKAIGAGFNQTEHRLTFQQMKQLIQAWDCRTSNYVQISHYTMFLVIRK